MTTMTTMMMVYGVVKNENGGDDGCDLNSILPHERCASLSIVVVVVVVVIFVVVVTLAYTPRPTLHKKRRAVGQSVRE